MLWSVHITSRAEAWGGAGTDGSSDAPLPATVSFILSPSRSGWCGGKSVDNRESFLDSLHTLRREMDIPAAAWLVRLEFGSPTVTLRSHRIPADRRGSDISHHHIPTCKCPPGPSGPGPAHLSPTPFPTVLLITYSTPDTPATGHPWDIPHTCPPQGLCNGCQGSLHRYSWASLPDFAVSLIKCHLLGKVSPDPPT